MRTVAGGDMNGAVAGGDMKGAVAGDLRGAAPDTGRGWFPQDAERHRRDAPKFCPACAAPLALTDGGKGIATEYWVASDRVFVCFCGSCGWEGDIVLSDRVVGHEAER